MLFYNFGALSICIDSKCFLLCKVLVYWIGTYNNVSKWPGTPRNVIACIGYRF